MQPEEFMLDKLAELTKRINETHTIDGFSRAERAYWLINAIRCEIDINSLTDVFIQLLPMSQIGEAIGYMRELGLTELPDLLQRALDLLAAHNYDYRTVDYYGLPDHVLTTMREFNHLAWDQSNQLWELNRGLYDLFNPPE